MTHLCLIVGCGSPALTKSPFCAPHRYALSQANPSALRTISRLYPTPSKTYLIALRSAHFSLNVKL